MRFSAAILSTSAMLILGCGGTAPGPAPNSTATAIPSSSTPAMPPAGAAATPAAQPTETTPTAAPLTAVALVEGAAELNPRNSRVQFIGTHVGEKPDPRLGGFEEFSGKLTTADGKLTGVTLEISTASLWTELGGKLTTHLKSPDFLDTKEYPEIKFQSTQVESLDGGTAKIAGELTLHGVTKPITIPATVTLTGDGATLVAAFTVDRTEFGITYEPDKVHKDVQLTVIVGAKTEVKTAATAE